MTNKIKEKINSDGDTLRSILNYCYSGNIEVTEENVRFLLLTADSYGFEGIKIECCKNLEQLVQNSAIKALKLYQIAHICKLNKLVALWRDLVCKHFMKIKDLTEFLELEYKYVFDLVKCDQLNVRNEEDVYHAVMKWIRHDEAERKNLVGEFFQIIRFTNMKITVKFLEQSISIYLSF